ncbi:MAG: hypothetical protein JNK60_22690, partial [Acidobacteria bacterium]|nr:hypothetical protein [Acidobacteriota bacterium]
MGTGHSADTPIRIAHLGISSVISLVDDLLLEKLRKHYCGIYGLPFQGISRYEDDGRARRITAYLETVREIVGKRMDAVRNEPFGGPNDKTRYFELLPSESPLARDYAVLKTLGEGPEREALERDLTARMRPGSIDVNIMVKLDRINFDREGAPLSDEFNDAKAALRGFAVSSLESSLILSAGMNQGLFTYMSGFRDFYRDEAGRLKKRIIIKVSDFRSALIQGKVLAKKGLEVHEFRIESGLNCGGHAFASNGFLLPHILRDFQASRPTLSTELRPLIQKHYEKMGWTYPESARSHEPLVTVQGGIGTHGEVRRLREGFGMDLTGWASPFLLVAEATCVDDPTRELLRRAEGKDLYLSDVSPLGVPFNNLRSTGSETWTQANVDAGRPGSACPSGFLAANTEFSEKPLCTAGREFQDQKLAQIEA